MIFDQEIKTSELDCTQRATLICIVTQGSKFSRGLLTFIDTLQSEAVAAFAGIEDFALEMHTFWMKIGLGFPGHFGHFATTRALW